MTTAVLDTPTVRRTGDDQLDALLDAIDAKPGQEVGRIARTAKVDKGVAGRLLTWAATTGYVTEARGKGGRRVYAPAAR